MLFNAGTAYDLQVVSLLLLILTLKLHSTSQAQNEISKGASHSLDELGTFVLQK